MPEMTNQLRAYLKLMRVSQWVKNLFVFLPAFFAGRLTEAAVLYQSIWAFFLFSFTASCVYIINDYSDRESDRKHPDKKDRPLASGKIRPTAALVLLGILLSAVALALLFLPNVFQQPVWKIAVIIGTYLLLNLAYTFRWKHIAVVDVMIIAIGFVLRVLAGGYCTGIPISQGAILLTFGLALVLALGKRRGELINAQITGKTRRALDGYNIQFADIALCISVTLAIISYLMFTVQPEVQQRFGHKVFYTFIFVVFAFLRYLQQTLVYNKTESPTKIIYRDRYIQVTILGWILTFLFLIYSQKIDFIG